jgi:[ribosomal protein S5]-alanine N-acetyltransferase
MMLTWFARDDTPVLTGQRVFLRAPRATDYTAWRDLRRARRGREEAKAGTDYAFFIFTRSDEELVGGITLSNVRRRAAQFVNLGYWMGHKFAGQGYMTEAVSLVVPYCFETLGLHRIHAAFLPDNQASRRVLEKNGFTEEGYAEHYLQIDGRLADHVLFGLTRERYDAAVRHGRR